MGIDIDGFLDKFHVEENEKKDNKKGDVGSLDFQKDVEDKIKEIQKLASKKDFELLLKIYNEIKNFDEDLPNKFYGINLTSQEAFNDISNRYTQEFLERIKQSSNQLKIAIENNLKKIDESLKTKNFQNIIKLFNETTTYYKSFPKEFLNEKIKIGKELKLREIKINEEFESFKNDELKKIRQYLRESFNELKQEMYPGNIKKLEETIEKIMYMNDKIPKIYYSELVRERVILSRILIEAENYMMEQYETDFNEKKREIFELFDLFHSYCIHKNVNKALTTYDEITILFSKLPDIMIEEKIDIYKHINDAFEKLNKLLLSSNVTAFLQTYNHGKILEEAREYLLYVKLSSRADVRNVLTILEKLKNIPEKVAPEKIELEEELKKILIHIKHNRENKIHEQESKEKEIDNFEKNKEIKNNNNNDKTEKPFEKEEIKKEVLKENNPEIELPTIQSSKAYKDENVSKSILKEINIYYERIKKTNNKNEIKLLYKKIIFYLNLLPISDMKKKETLEKINKIIKEKY